MRTRGADRDRDKSHNYQIFVDRVGCVDGFSGLTLQSSLNGLLTRIIGCCGVCDVGVRVKHMLSYAMI